MTSCHWLNNLAAVDPCPFDFEKIDFVSHPAFEAEAEQENVSKELSQALLQTFSSIGLYMDEYVRHAAGPGPLSRSWKGALSLFTDREDTRTIGSFRQRPEFSKLRKSLRKARKAIAASLQDEEQPILSKQYDRLELEVFRLLFYLDLRAKNRRRIDDLALSPAQDELATALRQNGIANAMLTNEAKQALRSKLQTYIDLVQKEPESPRETGKYDRACYFSPSEHAEVYGAVDALLSDAGAYTLATAYTGLSMELNRVVLHLARPGDEHIYQTFDNRNYTPKTINMHFDPKYGLMKLIIYLDRPEIKDGPFCYIPGSPNYQIQRFFKAAAKANSVTNYLQTAAERSAFVKLPRQMRCNAIFGSMLTDASPESRPVLESEVKLTAAEYGDFFLFDPDGMHRGGVCEPGGQRLALQVILRPTIDGKVVEGL